VKLRLHARGLGEVLANQISRNGKQAGTFNSSANVLSLICNFVCSWSTTVLIVQSKIHMTPDYQNIGEYTYNTNRAIHIGESVI
jgi:hypothetical protein